VRQLRTGWILTRHLYRVWRAGQLRFRLETFGVYYPALPYAAPWWKVSPRAIHLLLRQLGPYATWLVEMEDLRRYGPAPWWHDASQRSR
jgi:hypothetical protein